ncbi:hypothetical protein O59_000202 [Cellvibrio sp. BR]|nr:hypothetical protein O59_000202 [Cellvibrio sp. BR]
MFKRKATKNYIRVICILRWSVSLPPLFVQSCFIIAAFLSS